MKYIVKGSVRGTISRHNKLSAAVRSMLKDERDCRSLGGGAYSDSDTGIIYLENPHQLPPKAYAFSDQQEFTKWLRQACERKDFSYSVHDRKSWDEYVAEIGEEPDSDWFAQWATPGYKLFDAGATEIVEIWARGSLVALEDRKTADTEIKAMLNCLDDFHQQVVLNKERALHELATQGAGLSHHQSWRCLARIDECAETLGWK